MKLQKVVPPPPPFSYTLELTEKELETLAALLERCGLTGLKALDEKTKEPGFNYGLNFNVDEAFRFACSFFTARNKAKLK